MGWGQTNTYHHSKNTQCELHLVKNLISMGYFWYTIGYSFKILTGLHILTSSSVSLYLNKLLFFRLSLSLSAFLFASLSVSFCLWWFSSSSSFFVTVLSLRFSDLLKLVVMRDGLSIPYIPPLLPPSHYVLSILIVLLHNNVSSSLCSMCRHNKYPWLPLRCVHDDIKRFLNSSLCLPFWSVCLTDWE